MHILLLMKIDRVLSLHDLSRLRTITPIYSSHMERGEEDED